MQTLKIGFQENTHVGLKRKANEDSHGHKNIPGCGHVFVVCDGMGGHVGGKVASQTAVECILEYFKTHIGGNPNVNIHEALKFANTQVFAKALNDPTLKGMGTTCVVAIVQEDGRIYYGHVGDSRIYLQTNDKLIRITKDHSFVQYLVDSNQISEEEAEQHPNKNQILKALGIDENVEPEIPSEPICPSAGDILMLCSDGLCGMTTDKKMEKVLNEKNDGTYSDKLIQLALDGGGADNVTAIVVKVEESPFNKTTYALPKQLYNAPQAASNATATKKPSGIKQLLDNPKIKALVVVIVLLLAGIIVMKFNSKKTIKTTIVKDGVTSTIEVEDENNDDETGFLETIYNTVAGKKEPKSSDKIEDEKLEIKKENKSIPDTLITNQIQSKTEIDKSNSVGDTINNKETKTNKSTEQSQTLESDVNLNTTNNTATKSDLPKKITLDDKFKPKFGGDYRVWKEACDYIIKFSKRADLKNLTANSLKKMNSELRFDQVKAGRELRVKE